jgi:hypothetical protein
MAVLYSNNMLQRTPFSVIRENVLGLGDRESVDLVQYVLKYEGLTVYPEDFESLNTLNATISTEK